MSNLLNPIKAGLFKCCFFGEIYISRRTNFIQLLNNLGKAG